MTKTPTIGVCPACESEVLVLASGTARKHRDPHNRPCSGSGRKVAAILPLTFRRWLATQTNRRVRDGKGHWLDLHIGRIARHANRYTGRWSSVEELLERMVAYGVDPNSSLVTALPDVALAFESLTADPAAVKP